MRNIICNITKRKILLEEKLLSTSKVLEIWFIKLIVKTETEFILVKLAKT